MKPLVIEFLGTQGSGKTTLLPVVVSLLREKGIRAQTVVEAARPFARRTIPGRIASLLGPASFQHRLLWQVYYQMSALYAASFKLQNRGLVKFVNETQQARPLDAGVHERRLLFWFFRLCGSYAFLLKYANENEAIVFDDGFMHRTVHLNASPVEIPQSNNIKTYLSKTPLPDLVIVPRVPLSVCVSRVKSRGLWKYFREKTEDELQLYLAHSENIVDFTVNELHSKGCLIIEVDNSDSDVQRPIDELREKIKGNFVVA